MLRSLWALVVAAGDTDKGGNEGRNEGHGIATNDNIAGVDALGTVIASLATAGAFSLWSKFYTTLPPSPPPFFLPFFPKAT